MSGEAESSLKCKGQCLIAIKCTASSGDDCWCCHCDPDGPKYKYSDCCQPRKCGNYAICGEGECREFELAKKNGLCDNCHYFFVTRRKTVIIPDGGATCANCKEKINVMRLSCGHCLCARCMRSYLWPQYRHYSLNFEKCFRCK